MDKTHTKPVDKLAAIWISILWILAMLLPGCANEVLTPEERVARARMIQQAFNDLGDGVAQGRTYQPQYVQPYQPLYSPVFAPQPIQQTSTGFVPIPR
jgi:hypothetical protein